MSRPAPWRASAALLLALLGGLAGLVGLGLPLGYSDESLLLVGGERILHGELPYRDFYALYPPGQYYVAAALFAGFGVQVTVLRVYCIAVRALIALLLFLLTRRVAGGAAAFAVWVAALAWTTAVGKFGYPVFPALALVLAAFLALAAALDAGAAGSPGACARRAAAAGAALGAAALFRHDLAAYGLAAAAPLLLGLARGAAAPATAAAAPSPTRYAAARRLAPFCLGLAAAFLPPVAWLLSRVPWDEVVFELFVYPARIYPEVRALAYPPLFGEGPGLAGWTAGAPYWAPLAAGLATLAGIAIAAARAPRGERLAPARLELASLALLALLALNLARVRPDPMHVVAPLVVSFATAAGWARAAAARRARPALVAAAAVVALEVLAFAGALQALASGASAGLLTRPAPGAGRAAGLPTGDAHAATAAYLREVVPEGERIFVGCGRHDKLFANEPFLYFLAGRLPGGKYHALDPGVATTRPVQEQIVRGLVQYRVEWVVLSTRFDDLVEPNGSALSSGVTLLDDYLRSHYAPDRRFGRWLTVWRRQAAWETPPVPD